MSGAPVFVYCVSNFDMGAIPNSRSDGALLQVGVGDLARKLAEDGTRRKPATRRKRCLHSLMRVHDFEWLRIADLLITAEEKRKCLFLFCLLFTVPQSEVSLCASFSLFTVAQFLRV